MRDIKFRAWNTIHNKMLQWGNLNNQYNTLNCLSYEHMKVMQFTGLKDKNGKEIYEGDICKHEFEFSNGYGIVSYSPPNFQLLDLKQEYVCDDFTWEDWELFEIIGNIYENPKLLEVENHEHDKV